MGEHHEETDVGAVPSQVDEGNGWRLTPGDAEMLETAMLQAIAMDGTALDQKRQASQQRVLDQFTWEQVSAQTLEALNAYLQSRKR